MINIAYQKIKKHYKYKLFKEAREMTSIKGYACKHYMFHLYKSGYLVINAGYAWNGADWPAIDTDTIMAASLVHDVFCQAIEEGLLPIKLIPEINKEMIYICDKKGMCDNRKKRVKWAIDKFCNPHYTDKELKIYYA